MINTLNSIKTNWTLRAMAALMPFLASDIRAEDPVSNSITVERKQEIHSPRLAEELPKEFLELIQKRIKESGETHPELIQKLARLYSSIKNVEKNEGRILDLRLTRFMTNKELWFAFEELDSLDIKANDNCILHVLIDTVNKWIETRAFNPKTKISEINFNGFNPKDFRTNLDWRKLLYSKMLEIIDVDKSLGDKDLPGVIVNIGFEESSPIETQIKKIEPIPKPAPERPEAPALPEFVPDELAPAQYYGDYTKLA